MGIKSWILEKLNPAQQNIHLNEGGNIDSTSSKYITYTTAYNTIPVVRRAVDLLVNGCSSLGIDVGEKLPNYTPVVAGLRKQKLNQLLNFAPNPYQDNTRLKRLIFLDLIVEGSAYLHWDGSFLYHLPAVNVTINTDAKTYIKSYTYNSTITFQASEIIHMNDNGLDSIFRGTSRLKSVLETIAIRQEMLKFQQNFFKNNAVPGLVLKSPNVLGDKVKQRLIENWMREYNPSRGGKRPLVLDGGLELDKLGNVSFRELDFENSIKTLDDEILQGIGVPPILLEGGNNANITPNQKLMWSETIVPLATLYVSALERFFGYDLKPDISTALALRPELNIEAAYYSTLVNGGVLTPNEARVALRYPKDEDPASDNLRIPANIAGSAATPSSQGGRPSQSGGNN